MLNPLEVWKLLPEPAATDYRNAAEFVERKVMEATRRPDWRGWRKPPRSDAKTDA